MGIYDAPTDPATRALVVNEAEADTVRLIYRSYLDLASVTELRSWLARAGIGPKIRRRRPEHDRTFSRGALFHLLRNRVYLGEIVHQDRSFPGNHPAILDVELFETVQAKLAQQASAHADRPTLAKTAPLKGLLFDADGYPMTPTFTRRGSRLHRYYVSNPLLTGGKLERGDKIRRVAAAELEQLLEHRMAEILGAASASRAFERLLRVELHPRSIAVLMRRKSETPKAMRQRLQGQEELEQLGDDAVRLRVAHARPFLEPVDGRADLPRHPDQSRPDALEALLHMAIDLAHGPVALKRRRPVVEPDDDLVRDRTALWRHGVTRPRP